MHHFVVKFSKFSSPQAQGGIDPPNQNPADALECDARPAVTFQAAGHHRLLTGTKFTDRGTFVRTSCPLSV